MVRSDKTEKQIRNDCSIEGTPLWPDLPQQIVQLFPKNLSLLQNVCFSNTTKTWRTTQCSRSRCESPRLEELLDHKKDRTGTHHIVNDDIASNNGWWQGPYRYISPKWNRHKAPSAYCLGCSQGLVVRGLGTTELHLSELNGSSRCLPPLDFNVPCKQVVLSSPPKSVYCTWSCLVLTGESHGGFMYYKPGNGRKWIKEETWQLIDPNSSQEPRSLLFTNSIGFQGKFYALSLQGTLACIDVDANPILSILDVKRAIPSVRSTCFREYLIESCGEIWLVFLISKKSIHIVEDIEVFRLDFSRKSWMKVTSFGDQTLFVGLNCCMSISARKVGCKPNCIYYRTQNSTRTGYSWWVYDIECGIKKPGMDADSSLLWSVPILD